MTEKQSLIIYASHLNNIGGIETFVLNFCKRLKDYYDITFCFNSCDVELLRKIRQHVNATKVSSTSDIKCDILILATAWGLMPKMIKAPTQIQMIHADYVECIEGWNFKYKKLSTTTHHVAVSNHVAKQFEKATPFKIDKVIYNLL
jgi:hypothetical protein